MPRASPTIARWVARSRTLQTSALAFLMDSLDARVFVIRLSSSLKKES
jgi:hypothetical protein